MVEFHTSHSRKACGRPRPTKLKKKDCSGMESMVTERLYKPWRIRTTSTASMTLI